MVPSYHSPTDLAWPRVPLDVAAADYAGDTIPEALSGPEPSKKSQDDIKLPLDRLDHTLKISNASTYLYLKIRLFYYFMNDINVNSFSS